MMGCAQRVRNFDRRHPLCWDSALAATLTGICANATPHLNVMGAAALAVAGVAVAARRRWPLSALCVASAAVLVGCMLAAISGWDQPWAYLTIWVLLFNAGLRAPGRLAAVVVLAGLTSITALGVPTAHSADAADRTGSMLAVAAMSVACVLGGTQIRQRRDQLAVQRREIANSAAVAERSRIAQEMHDILGHNLSVIISLANGGATAALTAPDDAVRAFTAIGEVSRSSMRDIRNTLAVLRQDYSTDGTPLDPPPGLDDLPDLVESMRSAGLRVRIQYSGDLRPPSTGHQLAVYRIVQESMTNTLRHAGTSAHVHVTIDGQPGAIIVSVQDHRTHPPQTPPSADPEPPGHGLIGLRQRAQAFGGALTAGPTESGWLVIANIPVDPANALKGPGPW
ncbi:sensor histidine kinase [Rhodococcus erythropolis]|uniref:sensor histidine kinase n=1 Tax=Rhodococcus erythropolis TaxID=1833 RepID=UPI00301404A8